MSTSFHTTDKFFTSVLSFGVSKPNRFEVNIFTAGEQPKNATDSEVSLRCQSVDLPGRNIDTSPNENVYGPVFEVARGLTLAGTITMTFLLDDNLDIRRYFEKWQHTMYNPNTYDMYYYANYVKDMTIYKLSATDEKIYACNVLEVYPKTVDAIALDNNSRSESIALSVTMNYRDWEEIPV